MKEIIQQGISQFNSSKNSPVRKDLTFDSNQNEGLQETPRCLKPLTLKMKHESTMSLILTRGVGKLVNELMISPMPNHSNAIYTAQPSSFLIPEPKMKKRHTIDCISDTDSRFNPLVRFNDSGVQADSVQGSCGEEGVPVPSSKNV